MSNSLSTSYRMYFLSLHEYEEDDLLIEEMTGHEGMSQLFEFRLRLVSLHDDISPRRIIAKPAILRIETYDSSYMDGERHWNGVVSRFERTGRITSPEGHDLYTYECDIVPWFWFMTQHQDCRIFQNKTVREIIETIFAEFDYDAYRFELLEDHPPLEYCTQYNETTFAFISRLLEREGIHYYFRHNLEGGETRHLLVFSDNNRSNPPLEPDTIPFHHQGAAESFDSITRLSLAQQMRTRRITLRDWNFETKSLMRENTPTVLEIGEDIQIERHAYPGGFVDSEAGKMLSRVMMEAEESSHLRFYGESQVRTLAPGHTFTLEDHPFEAFNIEYMVLSVRHHGRNNLTSDSGPSEYQNEFTLQPHDVVWRPPQNTPKAIVRGPQTALVTGPSGEEIHTDEYGRIKIQFHWDREGQYDDRSSCWVRVAQLWAGNGYGTMFIPRVGMEVVVDFLEGDPDQPLVTGCVYNGVNRPPYQLPSDATKSTIKTLSSPGGGGTNELRFEDKKDEEEIFLQAEKDLRVKVKNDLQRHVAHKYTTLVEGDTLYELKGKVDYNVRQDWSQGVEGNYTLASKQRMYLGSARSDAMLAAQDNVTLTSSAATVQMRGMRGVVVESMPAGAVSLKCGPSSIVIDPSGVSITGPMVKLNSGGSPLSYSANPGNIQLLNADELDALEDGTVTDPIQQLQAQALISAARSGQPFCAECQAARAAYEDLMR